MVDWTGAKYVEAEVRKYFLCCPLCGNDSMSVNIVSLTSGAPDSLSCCSCGAKWHIYIGNLSYSLNWAELELPARSGEGRNLIGKRLKKDEIKKLAVESRLSQSQMNNKVSDESKIKEVIKEKEVLVKIRCSYCKSVYEEVLNKCPNCGASN